MGLREVPDYRSVGSDERRNPKYEIAVGDQLTLQFADDPRRISVRLTETTQDLGGGMLSSVSALGKGDSRSRGRRRNRVHSRGRDKTEGVDYQCR